MTFKITIKSCKDLKVADLFTSDPYVKVYCNGSVQQTKVIKNTLNPKFKQTFTFSNVKVGTTCKLSVWDWDKDSANDPLGDASFTVEATQGGKPISKKLKLNTKGSISIEYTLDAPAQKAGQPGVPGAQPGQPGYPPQGAPGQYPGYPPQGYPPYGYPPQGYPPYGYPPQGYPPYGYPPQQPGVPGAQPGQPGAQPQYPGYPPYGYPPQGQPGAPGAQPGQPGAPQGQYPGYPPQGYPPYGYPPQGQPGAPQPGQPAPPK